MKARDLHERTVEDLRELQKTIGKDLFEARFKNFTNRLDDTASLRKHRRELARIETVLAEKARGVTAPTERSPVVAAAPSKPEIPAAAPSKPAAEKPAAKRPAAKKPAAKKPAAKMAASSGGSGGAKRPHRKEKTK